MKASNYALSIAKRFTGGVAILSEADFKLIISKLQKLEDVEQAATKFLTAIDSYDNLQLEDDGDLDSVGLAVKNLYEVVKTSKEGVPI